MRQGIVGTAKALGVTPQDVATAISYETGGTFNPTQVGPTTKWGQHRGYIQFGEPQAKQFGVDWNNPIGSQLGENGAIVKYALANGFKPGMSFMDLYSTINAGAPGRYGARDAAAGGAPGTVADKVNTQMGGHRARARALFPDVAQADIPAAGSAPASMETAQPGFAVPPGPQPAMSGATFNAITAGQPLDPVFQSEGVSQPWMGTALAPAEPQMVQAPLPPSRPTDFADIPAPGAVPAIGQMPPQQPAFPVDPNSPDGGMRAMIANEAQGAAVNPFAGITRALTGGGAPAPSNASPAVQSVAQAVAPQAAASPAAPSNPMAALAIALARSGDRDGAIKLATSLLQPTNGVTMGDRLVDPRTGRVIADFSQANGGRSSTYGLQPIYGTGPDGKPVIMQIGPRGDAVATRLPEGVSLARDPIRVDGPTGTALLDPQTRQQVGFIPKDVAGAERQKAEGKAAGEAAVGLNSAIAQGEQVLGTIEQVRRHPGRSEWGAQGATANWPIIGGGLPGSKGRDFVGLVDQLKGQAFLDAFDALKGAGAISETEGKVATAARARLDRAQSKEGFDKALDDLEGVIRRGMENARKKAGAEAPAQAPSSGGWNEVAPGVRIREKR